MEGRPRYHAQDQSKDVLAIAHVCCTIADGRLAPPSLEREGFELIAHGSAVRDLRDGEEVARVHEPEIAALLQDRTGADLVVNTGKGVLRFSERSPLSGQLFNSRPARFAHIDVSATTARAFALRSLGGDEAMFARYRRFALYNVWRTFSAPPQDAPLALCDADSVASEDLLLADAVFDMPGAEFSFEGLVVRANPKHRWRFFPDMHRGEAIVFKTFDSAADHPCACPHVAFDDPECPADAAPRASIEMRAIAYFR
ncbi:MAG: hypothetical protein JNJ73_04960 [Hyphomonadaceae bacterium]|nr:hypothetical protein [Hyphomonadaceae bacterium]